AGVLRWAHDPGAPFVVDDDANGAAGDGDDDANGGSDAVLGARWRALACRALAHATGGRPGPVHLNLPFREPLTPTGAPLVDAPGRAGGRPWVVTQRATALPGAAAVEHV